MLLIYAKFCFVIFSLVSEFVERFLLLPYCIKVTCFELGNNKIPVIVSQI